MKKHIHLPVKNGFAKFDYYYRDDSPPNKEVIAVLNKMVEVAETNVDCKRKQAYKCQVIPTKEVCQICKTNNLNTEIK